MIKTQKTFNRQSIYLTKEKKQYKENGYSKFFPVFAVEKYTLIHKIVLVRKMILLL